MIRMCSLKSLKQFKRSSVTEDPSITATYFSNHTYGALLEGPRQHGEGEADGDAAYPDTALDDFQHLLDVLWHINK